MDRRDQIGRRGEFIACSRLLDYCGNPGAYFNPFLLGEKCPLFDLLVELEGLTGRAAYFLAQVKTTTKSGGHRTRLRVEVAADHVGKMVGLPFPAYLIGVDEPREKAYIVSVHGNLTGPISSMPRKYPLTAGNLKSLWDEVAQYWAGLGTLAVRTSRFDW